MFSKFIYLFMIFIVFVVNFSFGEVDLEQAMNPSDPAGIYKKIKIYYELNISGYFDVGYKKVASLYGTDTNTVKQIIEGNLEKCIDLLPKMGIQKTEGNYTDNDFYQCKAKLESMVNNYVTSSVNNKASDDATKGENVLADGVEDNGPYDLLIDIETISKILFKEELTFDDVVWDVAISNNNGGGDGGGDGNNGGGKGEGKGGSGTGNNNNGGGDGGGNGNNGGGKGEGKGGFGTGNNNGGDGNLNRNNSPNENISNPNLQFGNICVNNNDLLDNNGNNNNGGNGGGNGDNNQGDGFNVFTGGGDLGGFITGGIGGGGWGIGGGGGGDGGGGGGVNVGGAIGSSYSCPPEDYILAICVQLIPSGPRGPVGGTVRKRSIEEIIRKIDDTLKEMKQNWIIVADHGDESLDIDYKHIDLANIFAFDIVLQKKPVFDFKQDEKVRKQLNEPYTNWEGVPVKSAILYYKNGIGDPFDKENDKNKYLLTNADYAKPGRKVHNNYNEQVDANSSDGIYTLLGRIGGFVGGLNRITENLYELAVKFKHSAQTLNGKADITNF